MGPNFYKKGIIIGHTQNEKQFFFGRNKKPQMISFQKCFILLKQHYMNNFNNYSFTGTSSYEEDIWNGLKWKNNWKTILEEQFTNSILKRKKRMVLIWEIQTLNWWIPQVILIVSPTDVILLIQKLIMKRMCHRKLFFIW